MFKFFEFLVFGFWFLISCDGESGIIKHSTLNTAIFFELFESNLKPGKSCYFSLWIYSCTHNLFKNDNLGALNALNEGEKTKNLQVLCVFSLDFFIIFYLFGVCLSSFKALSTSSKCYMQLQVLCTTHVYLLFVDLFKSSHYS